MISTIKSQIDDGCAFLARFVSGERGFTDDDVLAGIGRLRVLHSQCENETDRALVKQWVRRCCEKLGRKDENFRWAGGE